MEGKVAVAIRQLPVGKRTPLFAHKEITVQNCAWNEKLSVLVRISRVATHVGKSSAHKST